MKTPIPWGRSLLLGILATFGLAVGTPVWMLFQMGRPVDFAYLWLAVGLPALLLALFVVKTRSTKGAIICGVLFSAPIAAFCWLLPNLEAGLYSFGNNHPGHSRQFRFDNMTTAPYWQQLLSSFGIEP